MAAAALTVAILALIVSIAAAAYARRQAIASEAQAEAVRRQEHRERTPQLTIAVREKVGEEADSAVYLVQNNGPQDLDAVEISRPLADGENGVVYAVAGAGGELGDVAELGPIPKGEEKPFVLHFGSAKRLPDFRVSVVARHGQDSWRETIKLDKPRSNFIIG